MLGLASEALRAASEVAEQATSCGSELAATMAAVGRMHPQSRSATAMREMAILEGRSGREPLLASVPLARESDGIARVDGDDAEGGDDAGGAEDRKRAEGTEGRDGRG